MRFFADKRLRTSKVLPLGLRSEEELSLRIILPLGCVARKKL